MAGREKASLEERFFEKVKKGDGCWEWTANRNNKGYGMLGGPKKPDRKGRLMLAHRVSYELSSGDEPSILAAAPIDTVEDAGTVPLPLGRGRFPTVARYRLPYVSMHVVKHIVARRTWKPLSELHD